MNFSSENLNRVFSHIDYDGFRNVMFDLADNKEIFEDGQAVSAQTANDKIRSVCFDILGINEKSNKRDRKRALKRHGLELFEVIEEVIDLKVATGFQDNEFFNEFVEERNLAEGDTNEFWTEDKVILNVAKVANGNHQMTIQTLGAGKSFSVTLSTYGVKVGKDIDLFLTGRLDWAKFTDAVAKAFIVQIQNELYAEVMNAASQLPNNAQFNKTGTLASGTKDVFDGLIEDVSTANDNAPVVIMGTKTALKKLNALADVDWASAGQKDDMAAMGRLGSYEGVALVEIPQRFKDNDVAQKLVDSTKLLIMPMVDNKFAKFVNSGDTEIVEVSEKGATDDDMQTYEVTRTMGIATVIGRYFGCYTIA